MAALINNVFVLMLENQSFDRLLGFSDIIGVDIKTGSARKIDGCNEQMINTYDGKNYNVTKGAPFSMSVDPNHEFLDVFEQVTGNDKSTYNPTVPYPQPQNSGFVKNYARLTQNNLGDILKCYTPDQLPVLTSLAKEFAVCDRWFSSIPGPTWPNRFFLHAGSSGGLDHSPSLAETAEWEAGIPGGFSFQNGSLYDRLLSKGISFRFYRGCSFLSDDYPIVSALKGIKPKQTHPITQFKADVSSGSYNTFYTFIEPSYGDIFNGTYKGGSSQHPMDDIRGGERLIKQVYEAIRNSPLWPNSLLIITWDEHGGFFDHVLPGVADIPGDHVTTKGKVNQYGFKFDRYGIRVPAVVVSPWIRKNIVDGTVYDHSSVISTLRSLKPSIGFLTNRDRDAESLLPLLSLSSPRTDALSTLPDPSTANEAQPTVAAQPNGSIHNGNIPGFAYLALKAKLEGSDQVARDAEGPSFKSMDSLDEIKKYYEQLRTKGDLA